MNKKINDILEDLDQNVDISDIYTINKVKPSDLVWDTTNDIRNDLEDADIWSRKHIKLYKTSTLNFDSLMDNHKLNDIDLRVKSKLIDSFFSIFKWINIFKRTNTTKLPFIWLDSNRTIFTNKIFRNILIILIIIIILWIINKNIIETKINSWYQKILSIKDNSWNIDFIKKQVLSAKNDFKYWNILYLPFLIIPHNDINNWYYLLKWWNNLTSLIEKWLNIYTWLQKFILTNWWIENIKLTNLLYNIKSDFSWVISLLYDTIVYYDKIGKLPNKDLNDKLDFARLKLKSFYKILDIINKDYDVFLSLLWHNTERKYLLIFQNNDEIRATWWFIWSVATITLRNWKVIDFVKEDVYSYEWDINKVMKIKEPAPEWLNKITDTFWFRDSNYNISFEASSNNIKWFLDKIDRHIDWIIYINQNTVLDFLKYTWWIKFDEIRGTITEENFSLIISTLVEAKVYKVWTLWTPKKILFNFINVFISKLKEKKDYVAYLDILLKNIKTRDLVIYSFNTPENNLLWKLWLNWKLKYSESLDFVYPVYTSIWWNKSDRYIDIKYKKNIKRNSDCSIDTDINIYRTHLFTSNEEQKVNDLLIKHWVKVNNDLINIQWKWDNSSYVRIILPKEAIVEPKEWLRIQKMDNFIMLDYYHKTRALESNNFDIKYRLVNKECRDYSYKLYKQPWIRKYNIEINDKDEVIKENWIIGDFVYWK